MNISRNNYEAFFLDFHEGNLSEEGKREVLAFVKENPELQEEFDGFEMVFIEKQSLKFPGKEDLKKHTINLQNYKTWLVAYVEGDLNAEERAAADEFLSANPAFVHELEILRHTKILPDYSIRFSGKSALKKGGIVVPMWVRYAAAACVVFGLLAYFFIQRKPASEFANESQPVNKVTAPGIVPSPIQVAETENEKSAERNQSDEIKPLQKKSGELKIRGGLAENDSVMAPASGQVTPERFIAEQIDSLPGKAPVQETTFVINEGTDKDSAMQMLVVLDDNDLAELGLKEKELPNSKLADAVNSVGKLLNVNAHYNKSQQPESKPTETWALGPLKIKRTVAR